MNEDLIMPKLTKQLTLPCVNGVDAVKKLRKLMKRGFKDDESGTDPNNLGEWNTSRAAIYKYSACYLVINTLGDALIVGHKGAGNMIKRVRDVEQHYVQD